MERIQPRRLSPLERYECTVPGCKRELVIDPSREGRKGLALYFKDYAGVEAHVNQSIGMSLPVGFVVKRVEDLYGIICQNCSDSTPSLDESHSPVYMVGKVVARDLQPGEKIEDKRYSINNNFNLAGYSSRDILGRISSGQHSILDEETFERVFVRGPCVEIIKECIATCCMVDVNFVRTTQEIEREVKRLKGLAGKRWVRIF